MTAMNRQDYLALDAYRLSRLVAIRVTGIKELSKDDMLAHARHVWTKVPGRESFQAALGGLTYRAKLIEDDEPFVEQNFPHYASDISQAFAVVEKLKGRVGNEGGWEFFGYGPTWLAAIADDNCGREAEHESLPVAICIAALLYLDAVEGR